MDGGVASDQRRASSQKPSVVLMQLLVCACETVAIIAFIATANANRMARFIFGFDRYSPFDLWFPTLADHSEKILFMDCLLRAP
jgi:hypothetical protein